MDFLESHATTNLLLIATVVVLWQVLSFLRRASTGSEQRNHVGECGKPSAAEIAAELRRSNERVEALLDMVNDRLGEIAGEFSSAFENAESRITTLLDEIRNNTNDVARNTMTQAQTDEKRFRISSAITLEKIRAWREGQRLQLISRSVFYPSDEPIIQTHRYKHYRIASEPVNGAYLVEGFEGHDFPTEEWREFKFYAGTENALTYMHDGEIREAW